ncbi:unnamed protein product [Brassicogethes aeneus]|uniref:Plexin domain-containing protein 2 n=1 Tax=Brassicogethes aeneus TaxID=1431903 RepID=A0A9P0B9Q1_BRAAE|nr:unnamed protein product [Brassicogethes aeneus]
MAWSCLKRSFWFICIFFVFRINLTYSYNDQFVYHSDAISDSPLDFKLLQNEKLRSLQKRDVIYNKTATKVPLTIEEDEAKPTKVPPAPILTSEVKTLGANGTGQRKYYPASPPPPPTQVNPVAKSPAAAVGAVTPINSTNNSSTDVDDENSGDDEVAIAKFSDPVKLNDTLTKHNITTTRTDTHLYYNSTFKTDKATGEHYWVDMENRSDVKVNALLSTSHRRAATIKLSFDFPFYGHLVKNVTIATGGFLYTGDYVHSWLAATQYIAPLMANFDTSLSNVSFIRYVDNGTAFTVEWEQVSLQDKPREGAFTFQVTLHDSGDVVFVYKTVPLFIENIKDDHHPVKVGLSDAYIMDRTVFFVRRKTIYEYHRVNFPKEDIKNWTVIYLKALPTCLESKDCETCLTKKIPQFKCQWCPSSHRCSNGIDRHRQDWLAKNCERINVNDTASCDVDFPPSGGSNSNQDHREYSRSGPHSAPARERPELARDGDVAASRDSAQLRPAEKNGVSAIVAVMFLICISSGLALWILYAYRNPHTTSGQMLIRYRPSQWHWRRGEARYTAATIHM